jgi:hypothetical protein
MIEKRYLGHGDLLIKKALHESHIERRGNPRPASSDRPDACAAALASFFGA